MLFFNFSTFSRLQSLTHFLIKKRQRDSNILESRHWYKNVTSKKSFKSRLFLIWSLFLIKKRTNIQSMLRSKIFRTNTSEIKRLQEAVCFVFWENYPCQDWNPIELIMLRKARLQFSLRHLLENPEELFSEPRNNPKRIKTRKNTKVISRNVTG